MKVRTTFLRSDSDPPIGSDRVRAWRLGSYMTSLQFPSRMFFIHVLCNNPKPINFGLIFTVIEDFVLNETDLFFFVSFHTLDV